MGTKHRGGQGLLGDPEGARKGLGTGQEYLREEEEGYSSPSFPMVFVFSPFLLYFLLTPESLPGYLDLCVCRSSLERQAGGVAHVYVCVSALKRHQIHRDTCC